MFSYSLYFLGRFCFLVPRRKCSLSLCGNQANLSKFFCYRESISEGSYWLHQGKHNESEMKEFALDWWQPKTQPHSIYNLRSKMMDRGESKQHIIIYLNSKMPRHSICSASLRANIKLALKTAWLSNSARCSPPLHGGRIWKILHFSKLLMAGIYSSSPPPLPIKWSMGWLTAECWPNFYFSFMF